MNRRRQRTSRPKWNEVREKEAGREIVFYNILLQVILCFFVKEKNYMYLLKMSHKTLYKTITTVVKTCNREDRLNSTHLDGKLGLDIVNQAICIC